MSDPRTIVLVHGVGIGPTSMEPLAAHLAAAGRETLVVHRPGYGRATGEPSSPVRDQAAAIVADVDAAGLGVVDVVGVSGGATIGLALAILAPERCGRIVLHEPLLGPLAPTLHHEISTAASALDADPSIAGVVGFLRGLAGAATWDGLDADLVGEAVIAAPVVRDEVPHFVAFAPGVDELAELRGLDLVTSVGTARPAPSREEAAEALARCAGADVVRIDRVGHLAHVDSPVELAALALSRPARAAAVTDR